MVALAQAFGSWLQGQFLQAARKRLGSQLFGSEQDRDLLTAAQAATVGAARELRPDGSDEDLEHLAAVLDQVFRVRLPADPLDEQPTILQALETGIATQLAVLGDAGLTGTGESSAQALGLPVEQITQALARNVVQEILARAARGGSLAPLADQLNHDLTHLQGQNTAGILEELVQVARQPATVAQPVPRELPRPIADFTARSDEIATLRSLLAPGTGVSGTSPTTVGRPVVISAIHGMGGIGKSALAIRVAHELVDAGAFPDGQLYVNLQGATPGLVPLDPLEALGRILRALGVEPAQVPTETEEAAARFRSLAAGRRLLVVLDNAASANQVRPLLPASSTCGALITSRQVLATLEGTRLLHLDILPPEQALELLARIAGAERVAADRHAADDVVQWCGYLPLAIRIAGARLAARPGWGVRVLAGRLAGAAGRLEELRAGELAVRASFEVSLDALEQSPTPSDRAAVAAFGLLSLPDGPDLGLAAAARLLDHSEDGTRRLLERLVDAQLLETPRPDRYQFHDLVRLYARERAEGRHPEAERLAALTRMLAFYTATAWRTLVQLRPGDRRVATADPRWTDGGVRFPDTSAVLAWLEAELANLLTAIPQAAAAAPAIPAELACELTRALYGFFDVRGYWQEGIPANRIALEVARRMKDLAAQAYAHYDLGVFHEMQGRHSEAMACYQDSLRIRRELGDRHGEAASLASIGAVRVWQGRYTEAIAIEQDSLTVRRELGDRHGEAANLGALGLLYWRLGRYTEAIACQQDRLAVFRELDDPRGEAVGLTDLGLTYQRLGRYAEAIACQENSLTTLRKVGDRKGEAYSLNTLGLVYERVGRYAEAMVCHEEGLTLFRELGDRWGEAYSLTNLGAVHERLGRYAEAVACQENSLTTLRKVGDRRGEAHALNSLGVVHERLGRYAEAMACQQDCLAIFRELGDRYGEAHGLNSLGVVYLQQERYAEASACQQDSLTICRELGDRHGEAESLRDLGDALRAVGCDPQAGAAWQDALAICLALQVPEADEVRDRLADLASQIGEPPA